MTVYQDQSLASFIKLQARGGPRTNRGECCWLASCAAGSAGGDCWSGLIDSLLKRVRGSERRRAPDHPPGPHLSFKITHRLDVSSLGTRLRLPSKSLSVLVRICPVLMLVEVVSAVGHKEQACRVDLAFATSILARLLRSIPQECLDIRHRAVGLA